MELLEDKTYLIPPDTAERAFIKACYFLFVEKQPSFGREIQAPQKAQQRRLA
jgi:hypothetical protein